MDRFVKSPHTKCIKCFQFMFIHPKVNDNNIVFIFVVFVDMPTTSYVVESDNSRPVSADATSNSIFITKLKFYQKQQDEFIHTMYSN